MNRSFQTARVAVVAALAMFSTAIYGTGIRHLPQIAEVNFWEVSSVTTRFSFSPNDNSLVTRRSDPLTLLNSDFVGVETEYYDVFYSDFDGALNPDGEYLTVTGRYSFAAPFGGGLNIAAVGLRFASGEVVLANTVTNFLVLGDNSVAADVTNAVDGSLLTWTQMGNTSGLPNDARMSLTVGFPPIPEPSTALLLLAGACGLILRQKLLPRSSRDA